MLSISIIIASNIIQGFIPMTNDLHNEILVNDAMNAYIKSVTLARSINTARTYRNAVENFSAILSKHNLSPETISTILLKEDCLTWFINDLKKYSPTTERLYLTAITGFFEYLVAENLSSINLSKIRLLIKQRARRPGQRLPQFPKEYIEKVIVYANNLASLPYEDEDEHLRNLRDRAFLITLADTGLRVHEACALRRGDIDWNEGKALIIGKGDRQAIIRFSSRALSCLRDYITARGQLDGASKRSLASLPLFARHDRGAGKKVKPITTTTGRNIVAQRIFEALGEEAIGTITPHSFRHYFVTTVLQGSGGNLKLAQELARHRNIAVTQRYAHLTDEELDKNYWNIFDDTHNK
jgi:integrase/recombinase XerC